MRKASQLIEIVPLPPQLGVDLSQVFADDDLPVHTHIEYELPPRWFAGAHEFFGKRVLFLLGEANGYGFGLASCQWHSSFVL